MYVSTDSHLRLLCQPHILSVINSRLQGKKMCHAIIWGHMSDVTGWSGQCSWWLPTLWWKSHMWKCESSMDILTMCATITNVHHTCCRGAVVVLHTLYTGCIFKYVTCICPVPIPSVLSNLKCVSSATWSAFLCKWCLSMTVTLNDVESWTSVWAMYTMIWSNLYVKICTVHFLFSISLGEPCVTLLPRPVSNVCGHCYLCTCHTLNNSQQCTSQSNVSIFKWSSLHCNDYTSKSCLDGEFVKCWPQLCGYHLLIPFTNENVWSHVNQMYMQLTCMSNAPTGTYVMVSCQILSSQVTQEMEQSLECVLM